MTGVNQRFDNIDTHDRLNIRCGKWSLSNISPRGSVIILQGRTEFIEKYDEVIDSLNKRRFWVYTFDWRGQGLSSRMLRDPKSGYVYSFDDYLRDLNHILDHFVLPDAPRPIIFLAHSMGGHLALRYLHDFPDQIQSAVLTSPMIDIQTVPFPRIFFRQMVNFMVTLGLGRTCLPSARSSHESDFKDNRLTSDRLRFEKTQRILSQTPELMVSGVTFQWLKAAFQSIDLLASPGFAETISTPVFLASAQNDEIVSNQSQGSICKKMPVCRMVSIPGARHEILQETDTVQTMFWESFDQWIKNI